MARLTPGPLADILMRNRERLNGAFARASKNAGMLDAGDFNNLLRGPIQKIVDAVAAATPGQAEPVLIQLYEIGLALFARRQLGSLAGTSFVARVWDEIFPAVPGVLAASPRRVIASLSNAAFNIGQENPAMAEEWLKRLAAIAPACSGVGELLDAALVLAWLSGLAHFRETGLERWRRMCDPIRLTLLGLKADTSRTDARELEGALANRWHPPHISGKEEKLRLVIAGTVGGFRGFGGPFIEPPILCTGESGIVASDGEACWSLYADCFGITLKRSATSQPLDLNPANRGFIITPSGEVSFGELRTDFPELAGYASQACFSNTLAVTLPHSHQIYVIAPLVIA